MYVEWWAFSTNYRSLSFPILKRPLINYDLGGLQISRRNILPRDLLILGTSFDTSKVMTFAGMAKTADKVSEPALDSL